MENAFKTWTTTRKTKHGYSIRCKKGFWGVDASTREEAEREAKYYFAQYFADGEYSRIRKYPLNAI